ncbi:MAG: hypothetical protein ACLPWS_22275 [Rhodomicrobium sp.]
MLESITLHFSECAELLVVPAQGVTILVDPNNSGKSLLLREIETAIATNGPFTGKVLRDFSIAWPTGNQFSQAIETLKKHARFGTSPDNVYVGRFNPSGQLEVNTLQLYTLE